MELAMVWSLGEHRTLLKLAHPSCAMYTRMFFRTCHLISCHNPLFFRQFGAQKASNGSVTFFVGFATKISRQKSATASTATTSPITTTPTSSATTTSINSGTLRVVIQDVGLFSTLVVALIIAITPL